MAVVVVVKKRHVHHGSIVVAVEVFETIKDFNQWKLFSPSDRLGSEKWEQLQLALRTGKIDDKQNDTLNQRLSSSIRVIVVVINIKQAMEAAQPMIQIAHHEEFTVG